MIQRLLECRVGALCKGYPGFLLTGPRQSGKTTFVRRAFPDLPYANLESPLERVDAGTDPLGFLGRFPKGAILDEVQNVPDLLSYLQVRIDEEGLRSQWVLTGSRQMDLAKVATQSLAGRVAIQELLPFSHAELAGVASRALTLDQAVLRGGYPPLYDEKRELDPVDWLENYLATHLHRDLRGVAETRNQAAFDVFLRACAARTGQLLNQAELARDCAVDQKTIGAWLSALETCYVIRRVRPYFRNFGKRLVKSAKLYFLDSGLACRLLNLSDVQQLSTHPLRGALVETWCYTEIVKALNNQGRHDPLWYWRSSDGIEVDFLLERGQFLFPIEVKAGATPTTQAASGIKKFTEFNSRDEGVIVKRGTVIYGGADPRPGSQVDFHPWHAIDTVLESTA